MDVKVELTEEEAQTIIKTLSERVRHLDIQYFLAKCEIRDLKAELERLKNAQATDAAKKEE